MSTPSFEDVIFHAIYELAVDHPMWIGDDGQPLDYLPEREARIGDFVCEAADAIRAHLAEHTDEAAVQPFARALMAKGVVCPVHGIPDCGPLLNGCSVPRWIAEWRGEFIGDLHTALAALAGGASGAEGAGE